MCKIIIDTTDERILWKLDKLCMTMIILLGYIKEQQEGIWIKIWDLVDEFWRPYNT